MSNGIEAVVEGALGWLAGEQAAMERLLQELVELSSHTPDIAGCTRVAERLALAMTALTGDALDGGIEPSASGRHGAHLAFRSRAAGRPVLLIGHHDTVFPRATFAGYREDGALLRGPGVLDMKGGLVVVAFALGALARADLLARVPLRFVTISDEEVGSPEGGEVALREAAGASCALVFESGRAGDEIITRRKGLGGLTVTAHGKAAHAGNAHAQGANAIWALARFVDGAQRMTDYDRGVTVNVGRIAGGMGKNTVPDQAEAVVDLRFLTAPEGASLVERLRAVAAEAAAAVPGTRLDVTGGVTRLPLERTAASAALLSEYAACARASGLGDGESPIVGGGSDANTVSGVGVPAIDGLGPRGKGYHTTDEQIERASLVPKAAALVRFLARRANPA
jgi:glutamate carboxypeptidase